MEKLNVKWQPKVAKKYKLYEKSVQDPFEQIAIFEKVYTELNNGKKPHVLREDFCGTYWISTEWVKKDPKNVAYGLDLDPEPLFYGREFRHVKLEPHQQKRLHPMLKNVMTVTNPKADVIAACNFSFNIFKDRKTLVEYFRAARKSLKKGGTMLLELAGGPEMMERKKERTRLTAPRGPNEKRGEKFTYIWHQKKYNPINHHALYSIHFKFDDGRVMEDAFIYDWRLWTVPELREAMLEAGFSKTFCFWETEHPTKDDEYIRSEKEEYEELWLAFVVGQK